MSIASEIQRITGNVADAYTAASGKGATMPVTQNSDNLASTINTISTGVTPTGTKSITANGVYDVTNYASADVQVPTTAPAHYIEKGVNANGQLIQGSSVINLSGVTNIGNNALCYAYYGNTAITGTADFSSLTTISGVNACYHMFEESRITGVDLSSLTIISGNSGCGYMFNGCTRLTNVDLSSLTTVSGTYSCNYMFQNCTGLTNVDLSSLTTVSSQYGCQAMFKNTGLTSVDLSSLTTVSGPSACNSMFYSCPNLLSVDLSSLVSATGGSCLSSIVQGSRNCTDVNLSSLKTITEWNVLSYGFADYTKIASLSFPSLTANSFGTNVSQFNNMFNNHSVVTVIHFPKNLDPQGGSTVISSLTGYPNFGGGANVTCAFDLPSTFILTGANTTQYERNPKYDTATALAWRVLDGGTAAAPIIDWTPFYTSTTADPVVGDTIYSDAACTTAVTTISSIA